MIDVRYKHLLLQGDVLAASGDASRAYDVYGEAAKMAEGDILEVKWVDPFVRQQNCLHTKGDNNKALDNLLPLLDHSDVLPPHLDGFLKRTLGNIYRSTANWHKAESHLSQAIDLARKCGDSILEGEWKGDLGQVYRSSGLHQRALILQTEAYESALHRGDRARLATSCGYIGFTKYALAKPDHEGALFYLGGRLVISEFLGDKSGIGWCLNNIGKVYHSLLKMQPAILFFKKRLQLAIEMGNQLGEGTALGNLGSAYRDLGEFAVAIRYHQQYLKNASSRLDIGGEAIMLRELVTDFILSQDFDAALEYAVRGMITNNTIRARLSQQDDQLKIANHEKNQSRTYSLLQFILTKLQFYDAALLVSEMGRARALCDLMINRSGFESTFLSDLDNITTSEGHISESSVQYCRRHITSLARSLQSTIIVFSILEEPALVSSSLCKCVYVWVVSPGDDDKECIHFKKRFLGIESVELTLDEDYLSGLRRSMETSSRDIKRKKPTTVTASGSKLEDLYNILIAPVEEYLPESDVGSKLVVIPHDFLFNLPFSALKSKGRFMIERFSISQAPSLAVLMHLACRPTPLSPPSKESHLIVGNPLMPRKDIDQLAGAEREAKFLHTVLGGCILTGIEASKEAVIRNLPRSPFIHLATHAILMDSIDDYLQIDEQLQDGDYSTKGAIILSKSNDSCSGILTSTELQQLDLSSCELLTLSCCWTACGKVTGDGILGLSRAVLVAGARCLVLTHWEIHDRSTPALMEVFYSNYKQSRDASTALRAGMLRLIQDGEPVAHWAAFCVLGLSPGMVLTPI